MYRKIAVLFVCLLVCGLVLTACGIEKKDSAKVRDMDYTVLQPEEVPDELKEVIEEKKEGDFKVTYTYGGYLYIARGFGMQETGGYSIQVTDLSASVNAVFFETKLIGPTEEVQGGEPSYPYIVVKTEYRDVPVQFR